MLYFLFSQHVIMNLVCDRSCGTTKQGFKNSCVGTIWPVQLFPSLDIFGLWSLVIGICFATSVSDFVLLGWIRTLDFERENSGTLKTFLFAQKDCHQNADGKSFGIDVLNISWQPCVQCMAVSSGLEIFTRWQVLLNFNPQKYVAFE